MQRGAHRKFILINALIIQSRSWRNGLIGFAGKKNPGLNFFSFSYIYIYMEKTLQIIEELQQKGLMTQYAIGGGIAAVFYIESIMTFDIDIFFIPAKEDQTLMPLSPIYEYLKNRGYKPEKEHIIIEGIPVQFLPAFNQLVEKAVIESVHTRYKEVNTRVMKLEYLIAIMLQTNRPKDRERVVKAIYDGNPDMAMLKKVLIEFELSTRLDRIMEMYNAG